MPDVENYSLYKKESNTMTIYYLTGSNFDDKSLYIYYEFYLDNNNTEEVAKKIAKDISNNESIFEIKNYEYEEYRDSPIYSLGEYIESDNSDQLCTLRIDEAIKICDISK